MIIFSIQIFWICDQKANLGNIIVCIGPVWIMCIFSNGILCLEYGHSQVLYTTYTYSYQTEEIDEQAKAWFVSI